MKPEQEMRRGSLPLMVTAALVLANSGCMLVAVGAGAAAGGAGYAYYQGKHCRSYAAAMPDVLAAAATSLGELQMPIVSTEQSGSAGTFTSRTADGDLVRVYIETQPSAALTDGVLTRVCVRVATFGDEKVSTMILDQIGYHLVPAVPLGPPGVSTAARPAAVPSAQTPPPPLLQAEQGPSERGKESR